LFRGLACRRLRNALQLVLDWPCASTPMTVKLQQMSVGCRVQTQSGVGANKQLSFISGTWLEIEVTDTALLPLAVQHVEQLASVTEHMRQSTYSCQLSLLAHVGRKQSLDKVVSCICPVYRHETVAPKALK